MRRFGALVLLALAASAGSRILLAQDARLQFEVASVRPSGPVPPGTRGGRGGLVPNSPDRLTYQRVLFRTLLMDAHGVERDQIKGPGWATADAVDGGVLFDVSAKVPPGATKEQVAAMLQNLLTERFKLSLHREQTQVSGYALVAAKAGPKLKKSAGPPRESERIHRLLGDGAATRAQAGSLQDRSRDAGDRSRGEDADPGLMPPEGRTPRIKPGRSALESADRPRPICIRAESSGGSGSSGRRHCRRWS